jgi:hypothetical protein
LLDLYNTMQESFGVLKENILDMQLFSREEMMQLSKS